jgi:hypothetical protein
MLKHMSEFKNFTHSISSQGNSQSKPFDSRLCVTGILSKVFGRFVVIDRFRAGFAGFAAPRQQ